MPADTPHPSSDTYQELRRLAEEVDKSTTEQEQALKDHWERQQAHIRRLARIADRRLLRVQIAATLQAAFPDRYYHQLLVEAEELIELNEMTPTKLDAEGVKP